MTTASTARRKLFDPTASLHALACLAGLLCVCPVSTSANGGVSGHVLDTQGRSVAGAHVKLVTARGDVQREMESDAQGYFSFQGIPEGRCQLIASADLFAPISKEVLVSTSASVEADLQFQQLAKVVQAVTVSGSETAILTPDASQLVIIHDPTPIERVVGVPLLSYVSLSWTYHFGR